MVNDQKLLSQGLILKKIGSYDFCNHKVELNQSLPIKYWFWKSCHGTA